MASHIQNIGLPGACSSQFDMLFDTIPQESSSRSVDSEARPNCNSGLASFTCRIAANPADFEAVYRLRYEVYVAEQGKHYLQADHQAGLLRDELDDDAVVVLVEADGAVCGTVRANWFNALATQRCFEQICQLEKFSPISPGEISICSRLAVHLRRRNARARELLLNSIYECGIDRETKLCFVNCVPALRGLFRRYGCREYAPPFQDSAAGKQHRMLLVLDDVKHLSHCGSPLLEIAQRRQVSPANRPWLSRIFHEFEVHNGGI